MYLFYLMLQGHWRKFVWEFPWCEWQSRVLHTHTHQFWNQIYQSVQTCSLYSLTKKETNDSQHVFHPQIWEIRIKSNDEHLWWHTAMTLSYTGFWPFSTGTVKNRCAWEDTVKSLERVHVAVVLWLTYSLCYRETWILC